MMSKDTVIRCLLVMAFITHSVAAIGHEFWIAPQHYMPQIGGHVIASIKTGIMMNGTDYPYLSDRFQSFTLTARQVTQNIQGNEGDIPAIAYDAHHPGLNILAFHSTPLLISHITFEEFSNYLEYQGLGEFALLHQERGLPKSGFFERYIRYAKALIQVGSVGAEDRDRALGLPLEIVAQANPYTAGLQKLPVILLWQGEPVTGRQLEIFRKNGDVTRNLVTTDEQGRADIPLVGGGEFLLNAVAIESITDHKIVWRTHWASLTFKVPIQD